MDSISRDPRHGKLLDDVKAETGATMLFVTVAFASFPILLESIHNVARDNEPVTQCIASHSNIRKTTIGSQFSEATSKIQLTWQLLVQKETGLHGRWCDFMFASLLIQNFVHP
jgi:hypothetical protein